MQKLVVGPYIAYCLCFRVASVDVVVPAPAILCFAPLSIVTAIALERDVSGETSGTKHVEEAQYLEGAKKVRGTLEKDRSNATCSALTSVLEEHVVLLLT